VSATGSTIADEEAGDVAFDETLVKIDEEMTKTLVGPTVGAPEEADEGIEDDETSTDALDGIEEAREVLWQREGMMTSGVGIWERLLDEREDFDPRKISPEGSEELELGGSRIG
jgi:hypothetical protein